MIKTMFFFFYTLIFMISGCKDNNPVKFVSPCGGTLNGIVARSPYDGPIWHPSGKFIGFNHTPLVSISYPHGEECQGQQHFNLDSTGFWLINPDGSNMHRIFSNTLQTPSWSPDGQWIAFVANAQIYKMRFTGTTFDTTTLAQLTTEGRNFFPSWSPDGKWIAYNESVCDNTNKCGIWLMKSDGTQNRFLAAFGNNPDWNPDNSNILYLTRAVTSSGEATGDSLWTFNIQTWERNFFLFLGENHYDNRFPKYSADGITIAFTSRPNGGQPQIWIMNSDGSNKSQLTTEGVHTTSGVPFSWSQDGSSIVYTKYSANDWTYNNGTLWILNTQTGAKRQLTFNAKPK